MNDIIALILVLIVVVGCVGLVTTRHGRRGISEESPDGIQLIRIHTPPPVFLWVLKEWRLTCFLTGITQHYRDTVPTVEVMKDDTRKKAHIIITTGHGRTLESVNANLARLLHHLEAEKWKVLVNEPRRIEVLAKYDSASFYNTTQYWTPERRDTPGIPESIPLGIDDEDRVAMLPLYDSHVIIAGQTGSGKGSVLWSIIGAVCGRDDVVLHGIDLKNGAEMKRNPHVFETVAYTNEAAAESVENIYNEMDRRAQWMEELDVQKLPITPQTPLLVFVIDEALSLSRLINTQRQKYGHIGDMFSELMNKARAYGIVIIVALQNPNLGAFEWADLFPTRVALRMGTTKQIGMMESDSLEVLTLKSVPAQVRGMCLIQNEEGAYTPVKVFLLEADVIKRLPKRGGVVQEEVPHPWSPGLDIDIDDLLSDEDEEVLK